MALRIGTNMASLRAQGALVGNQNLANKSMEQLATGSRINSAADDAAGLSISEGLKAEIRGLGQANRNAQDGVSMIQVAEGGLQEVSNIMSRFKELSIQAASDTIGDNERAMIQTEVEQLMDEVDRIAESTTFGSKQLLNGTGGTFDIQVGTGGDPALNAITYDSSESDTTLATLGLDSMDFSSKSGAQSAISQIETAQNTVNRYRANLGAIQNRLGSTSNNLQTAIENTSAANSRIRDADIAAASADLTKSNILLNATTSILGQANAFPAQALRLVG